MSQRGPQENTTRDAHVLCASLVDVLCYPAKLQLAVTVLAVVKVNVKVHNYLLWCRETKSIMVLSLNKLWVLWHKIRIRSALPSNYQKRVDCLCNCVTNMHLLFWLNCPFKVPSDLKGTSDSHTGTLLRCIIAHISGTDNAFLVQLPESMQRGAGAGPEPDDAATAAAVWVFSRWLWSAALSSLCTSTCHHRKAD